MTLPKRNVLLVEDELNLAFSLKLNLEAEGYKVHHVSTGAEAVSAFQHADQYAAILLDVMLPELDGFQVAAKIRGIDPRVGILMLTAKDSDEDRVQGFESGVDDYLTKPFHLPELLLRVKRMMDRVSFLSKSHLNQKANQTQLIKMGRFTLDEHSLRFSSPKGDFAVTEIEAGMLREFLTHPRQTLTRDYLLQHVWGIGGQIETRTVDNFVLRLRRMIEVDPSSPQFLRSIRGRGYELSI